MKIPKRVKIISNSGDEFYDKYIGKEVDVVEQDDWCGENRFTLPLANMCDENLNTSWDIGELEVLEWEEEKVDVIQYKCPYCKLPSTADEWNKITQESYSDNITEINGSNPNECDFICPACGEESTYKAIVETTDNITITRKEYEELLEYKAMYEGLDR